MINCLPVITDHTTLLAACQKVASQVRLFQHTAVDLDALFRLEVLGQIPAIPAISILDHAALTAYATGYMASLTHSIRSIECEYVYRSSMGVLYSVKVNGVRPYFGDMTMAERETASTGHVWKGSNAPFSAFTREVSASASRRAA